MGSDILSIRLHRVHCALKYFKRFTYLHLVYLSSRENLLHLIIYKYAQFKLSVWPVHRHLQSETTLHPHIIVLPTDRSKDSSCVYTKQRLPILHFFYIICLKCKKVPALPTKQRSNIRYELHWDICINTIYLAEVSNGNLKKKQRDLNIQRVRVSVRVQLLHYA